MGMNGVKTGKNFEGSRVRELREISAAHRGGAKKSGTIDMKGAVQSAFAFTKDMFPQAKDIRLEEVEPGSVGWTVVISFSTGEPGTLAQVMGGGAPRLFKTIAVDSTSGKAQSLKVWKQ
jgi:hypothetical protein